MTVFGILPKTLSMQIGAGALINNHVIIPAGKKIASGITTSLGLLNKDEAKGQEELFDEMISPYTDIMNQMEQEFINMITNGWNQVVDAFMPDGEDK